MKKVILAILTLLICSTANAATTYYVRVSGGTNSQCNGTTNSDYSAGTSNNCAFNNPSWALGAFGTSQLMVAGDTLMIDSNGGTAQYMIGYGMPNTAGCVPTQPYACVLKAPPSGVDINHPTKIFGSEYATGSATTPQLWGTQSVYTVLSLTGVKNIDIESLEITDHSTCTFRQGQNICSETFPTTATYGRNGIEGVGATNVILKNVSINGMSRYNMIAGDFSGVNTFSHVNIWGGGFNGWDMDDTPIGGTGNANFGTLSLDFVNIQYSGCQQAYPHSASFTASDYSNCTDQNASGQGDGFAGGGTSGTINITNSTIGHNVQDNIDFLHASGQGTFNLDKNLIEGGNGNQFKFTAKNVSVTNNIIIANCNYFSASSKIYNTSSFVECRANGSPMSASTGAAGGTWRFEHNTMYTSTGPGGSPALEVVNGNGLCNGTESYIYKNNIFVSNNSATNWTPFYSNLSGSCATPFNAPTNQYNTIYHFNNNPAGTGNVFTNPLLVGSISNGAASNLTNVYIQTSSPAKGTATTGTYWNTSNDYNNFPLTSPPSMGGLQFGSSLQFAQSGQACTATTDCLTGTCSNFACTGGCTNNGGVCATGATCCSATCTASVCAVPAICGDTIVQPSEICDTNGPNLNGATCIQQSFTGGTLGCTAGCQSYNTASCTNTTLFPLTPILDSFTRSNSTGLGTPWQNLTGRMDISSNTAKTTTVGGFDAYMWPTQFTADQQVYVTMSTKGTDHDSIELHIRYNPTDQTSYYIVYNGSSSIELKRSSSIDHSSEVQIGATVTQSMSSGDSLGVSVVGSTFTLWYKASAGAWTSLGTRTDTTYTAAGNLVFSSYNVGGGTPDIRFTNFGGGSVNPVVCGNGLKEGSEACDGLDVGGLSCLTQHFASGTLTCASNCQSVVTTACVSASVCGNNIQETGEICDLSALASQTCIGLGYASGTLACNTDCLSYDTSNCVSTNYGVLGGVHIQ